jgi:hypothetical protein
MIRKDTLSTTDVIYRLQLLQIGFNKCKQYKGKSLQHMCKFLKNFDELT